MTDLPLPLIALAAVFVAWWSVSAGNQVRSGALMAPLRRCVPFSLIPLWTFFAPNPARADLRLVFREERDGRWEAWQELHFGYAPLWRRWLVNPELILNKAVTDLVTSLLRVGPELPARSMTLTSAYVALLNIVLDQRQPAPATALQFAVVRTAVVTGVRQVDVAFLSDVHALAEPPARVLAS